MHFVVNRRFHVSKLALALAAYRADHNHYPPSPAELLPACRPAVPQDIFTNKPLVVTTEKDGTILIYSVGPNQTDDHGQAPDASNAYKCDDIAIRLPPLPPNTQPR